MIGISSFFSSEVVAPIYSVLISPSPISASDLPAGSATSITAKANVFNGTPPFTYLWTQESGDAMTINSDTSESTTFTTSGAISDAKDGSFKVTVTDDLAVERDTTVSVAFIFAGTPL